MNLHRLLVLLLAAGPVAPSAPPASDGRLEIALRAYHLAAQSYRSSGGPVEGVANWSTRLFELQKRAGVANAGVDYVYRMKDIENVATSRAKGRSGELDVLEAKYRRIEAELAAAKK